MKRKQATTTNKATKQVLNPHGSDETK